MSVSVNVNIFYGVVFRKNIIQKSIKKFNEDTGEPYFKQGKEIVYEAKVNNDLVQITFNNDDVVVAKNGTCIDCSSRLKNIISEMKDNPEICNNDDDFFVGYSVTEYGNAMCNYICDEIRLYHTGETKDVDDFYKELNVGLTPKFYLTAFCM